jgi:predicted ATP-grasp superfamily ATP-dependent carboligase
LICLPACKQVLSDDGCFRYCGGQLPLPEPPDDRARRLALAAVRTLPKPQGYLGVDLVLGDDPQGHGDAIIEINPRLTTSYVGLRALARENLAGAMLAVARGQQPVCRGVPAE